MSQPAHFLARPQHLLIRSTNTHPDNTNSYAPSIRGVVSTCQRVQECIIACLARPMDLLYTLLGSRREQNSELEAALQGALQAEERHRQSRARAIETLDRLRTFYENNRHL